MRERAVRDDALRVALGERGQRAVEQRDRGRARTSAAARRAISAAGTAAPIDEEAVEPGLRLHRRDDRDDRRRQLGVRVGHPRMEREHRRLHQEREREAGEDPHAPGRRRSRRAPLRIADHVGRAGQDAERRRRQQQREAAGQVVDQILPADARRRAVEPTARGTPGSASGPRTARTAAGPSRGRRRSSRLAGSAAAPRARACRGELVSASAPPNVASESSRTIHSEIARSPRWNEASNGRESQCAEAFDASDRRATATNVARRDDAPRRCARRSARERGTAYSSSPTTIGPSTSAVAVIGRLRTRARSTRRSTGRRRRARARTFARAPSGSCGTSGRATAS